MKKQFLVSALVVASLPAFAQSLPVDQNARLSTGVNVGHTVTGYRADDVTDVLPQAFYDNNRFYIEGSEAGVYTYKDSQHHARLGLTYDGRSFDPDDAHNEVQGLDERKNSIMAHASYMYVTPVGGFRLKLATDVSNRHDGTAVTLSHLSKFEFGDGKATLYPQFGVTWRDESYNNYYYGVSANESARTGLQGYQADSGVNPFVSATLFYHFTDNVSLVGNQRLEWLSDEQKNSPMTDGNVISATRIGLNYKF